MTYEKDSRPPAVSLKRSANGNFPVTSWSTVVAAASNNGAERRKALDSICCQYWYPVYVYIRRRGYSPDEAEDLTQSFFVSLLGREYFHLADPTKGHFRSFLISSVKFFLANQARAARRLKRGGGLELLTIDGSGADARGGEIHAFLHPAHRETPERIFERRWASALLNRAAARLHAEFARNGRLEYFNRVTAFVLGQSDVPYSDLARRMQTSEGALKVAITRLRKHYRELLVSEISKTIPGPDAVDRKVRYLTAALTGE